MNKICVEVRGMNGLFREIDDFNFFGNDIFNSDLTVGKYLHNCVLCFFGQGEVINSPNYNFIESVEDSYSSNESERVYYRQNNKPSPPSSDGLLNLWGDYDGKPNPSNVYVPTQFHSGKTHLMRSCGGEFKMMPSILGIAECIESIENLKDRTTSPVFFFKSIKTWPIREIFKVDDYFVATTKDGYSWIIRSFYTEKAWIKSEKGLLYRCF